MKLLRIVIHQVFLSQRRDVPLSNLKVLTSSEPCFVLRHVPYLDLRLHSTEVNLVKQLNSTSDPDVKVQYVVGAKSCIHCVGALRSKRVQALR